MVQSSGTVSGDVISQSSSSCCSEREAAGAVWSFSMWSGEDVNQGGVSVEKDACLSGHQVRRVVNILQPNSVEQRDSVPRRVTQKT